MGTVYVSGDCRAPKDELRQLILSGGKFAMSLLSLQYNPSSILHTFCLRHSSHRSVFSLGGSVANTARVASVVVGEFRDPGDNQ